MNEKKKDGGLNLPPVQKNMPPAVDVSVLDQAFSAFIDLIQDIAESLNNIDCSLHVMATIERRRAVADKTVAIDEFNELDDVEDKPDDKADSESD